MKLDYSAVPRMPDGRTAAEHIQEIEATARAVASISWMCSAAVRPSGMRGTAE